MSLTEKVEGIRDRAIARGLELVEEKGPRWAGLAVDKAGELAEGLDGPAGEVARAAVAKTRARPEVAEALAGLAVDQGRAVLAHVWRGDFTEARRIYLEREATYAERRAAMQAGTDAVYAQRQAREARWQELLDWLADLGEEAIKVAIPLLLAALV